MQFPSWFQTVADPTNRHGQPLYQCHATDEQYQELCATLKQIVSCHGHTQPPRSRDFAGAYVLFGALWISRNYVQGAWSWDDIDNAIGANFDQNEHTQLVYNGASFWKHSTQIQQNGKRFIGYIMAQAGLPIKALVNESGWAARCLNSLLRFLKKYPDAQDLLDGVIQAHLMDIKPMSFDDEHYRNLLREGCISLTSAIKSLPAEPSEKDIRHAWNKLSNFPAAYSIPLENFKNLLKHYENDDDDEQLKTLFSTQRFIHWDGTQESKPVLFFVAKTNSRQIQWNELTSIFPSLTSINIEQQIQDGASGILLAGNQILAKIRYIGNSTWYVTPTRTIQRSNAESLLISTLEIRIHRTANAVSSAPLGASSNFAPQEPAIFVAQENAEKWRFYGSGNVSTPAGRALVLCPSNTEIRLRDTGHFDEKDSYRVLADPFFTTNNDTLKLIETKRSLILKTKDEEFNIQLRDAKGEEFSAWFSGECLGATAEGIPIYRGTPKISSTCSIIKQHWKIGTYKDQFCTPPKISSATICTVTVAAGETASKRLRALVLPPQSNKRVKIGSRSKSGKIVLSGWGHLQAVPSCQTITPWVEDNNVVLECSSTTISELLQPFTVFFKNSDNGSIFSLSFEYPQRSAVARLGQQVLKKDAEVSLDEVRQVVFSIVDPQNAESEGYLMMEPVNPPVSLQGSKQCRLWIPVYIHHDDHAGRLVYEDFRDELFRLMRLDTGSPRSVRLRLIAGSDEPFIRVVQFGENLSYLPTEDAILYDYPQPRVTEATKDSPCRKIRFVPLIDTDQSKKAFIREIKLGQKISLRELIPDRNSGWVITALDDEWCRIRPLVIPPETAAEIAVKAEATDIPAISDSSTETVDRFSDAEDEYESASLKKTTIESNKTEKIHLASIRSIWNDDQISALDRRYTEHFVVKMITEPSSCERAFFERLFNELGHRAFAFLPFWDALREDVPLALAFALSFDLTMPSAVDGRSLSFSVGRYHAWRWDLLSIDELVILLNNLQVFFKNQFQKIIGPQETEQFVWNQIQKVLSLDVAVFSPVLRERLVCALVQIKFPDGNSTLWNEIRVLPYFTLTAQGIPSENDLSSALKTACEKIGPDIRLSDSRSKAGSAPEALEDFMDALKQYDKDGAKFAQKLFCDEQLSEVPRENMYMQAVLVVFFAWIRGYAKKRQGNPNLLIRLAGKTLFFFTETMLAANIQWTSFCASFSEACAIRFYEDLKNKR